MMEQGEKYHKLQQLTEDRERWRRSQRKVKKSRALNETPYQSYRMSLAIWDQTVLPATRHKWTHPTLTPARGLYSIYLPRRDGRLSWARWLVTYPDGSSAHRRSPIKVLTWPGVKLATSDTLTKPTKKDLTKGRELKEETLLTKISQYRYLIA